MFEVTLVATGDVVSPKTSLESDGFEVNPDGVYGDLKDESTEDEKVRCDSCGVIFELYELEVTK